jgi:hypothetical protein
MNKEYIILTEDQVSQLNCEENATFENNNKKIQYSHISEKIIDFDQEKSSVTKLVTIKDLSTGLKYKGEIGESPWCDQSRENAKTKWYVIK